MLKLWYTADLARAHWLFEPWDTVVPSPRRPDQDLQAAEPLQTRAPSLRKGGAAALF